ncbi:coiled-coil domain-containing protein [Legionella tunisiensis]|uniref:hypothetical protein n=1 Tax=Legionella tunisiensis TaxID=1034944 RepID=UPI0002E7E48F|nr:hypothetical protein [Legionella tunisiensis]
MPILEVVAGGYLVGKGAMIISAAVGGTLALAGSYLFGAHSPNNKEALATLVKAKEETEKERMQNLDSVIEGIQQRKEHLTSKTIEQQTDLESAVWNIEEDRTLIHEQAEQLTKTTEEVEQTTRTQEELIIRLQLALQEKMNAFEEAQKQLLQSNARLEITTKELAETRERVASSEKQHEQTREEIKSMKEQMALLVAQNKSAMSAHKSELTQSSIKIETLSKAKDSLTVELEEANSLIETLTEQLEATKDNAPTRPVSPRFFREGFPLCLVEKKL